MERNGRVVVASLFLVWISLDNPLVSLASAGGAPQDLPTKKLTVRWTGRLLLQERSSTIIASSTSKTGIESHNHLPKASIIVGFAAAAIAFIFLLLTAIGYFQNRWAIKAVDSQLRDGEASAPPFMLASEAQNFSYKELQAGTLNFTEKLGRGGRVYRGVLSNLTEVAVKNLVDFPKGEFEQDVKKAAGLRYKGLVHLYGYCSDGDHRLLVYEYLPKGSLCSYLYTSSVSHPPKNVLDWSTRFNIMLGAARTIAYVHERGSNDPKALKVHGRIHPENILMTENYDPTIADFGFSRSFASRDLAMLRSTSTAAGKLEYFAPEWWTADPITTKADVYSFGILMLEIISGRRIAEVYVSKSSWDFPDLNRTTNLGAAGVVVGESSSAYTELVDPQLKGIEDVSQIQTAMYTAYWCIQTEVDARPSMAVVLGFLQGRVEVEQPPKPSSAVVFAALRQHSNSARMQNFRFGRRHSRVEIINSE